MVTAQNTNIAFHLKVISDEICGILYTSGA